MIYVLSAFFSLKPTSALLSTIQSSGLIHNDYSTNLPVYFAQKRN